MPTRKGWEAKLAELEEKLLGDHHLLGQAIGVPFLIVLYPPVEEVRVRGETSSLARSLQERGVSILEIDCASLMLEILRERDELQRVMKAERKDPAVLRDLGFGPLIADELSRQIQDVASRMNPPCAIFLKRLAGLHPFVTPPMLQEHLAGTVPIPVVFFIPAEALDESHYLFMGTEKTLKYRGIYV